MAHKAASLKVPPLPVPPSESSNSKVFGILPGPEVLAKYEEPIKGGAERIMAMAEAEQRHRHDMDKARQQSSAEAERRGQWIGGVVIAGMIATV